MKFNLNDGGRSTSKRPKQTNDCTVRAFAISFNMGYDIAYEYLAKQGRECSQGFELNKLLEKTPNLFDKKVTKLSFPAKKGVSRMNVKDFVSQYTNGTYIIRVSKHMACVKDGVLEDTYNSYPFKCVYTAFKVE